MWGQFRPTTAHKSIPEVSASVWPAGMQRWRDVQLRLFVSQPPEKEKKSALPIPSVSFMILGTRAL